MPRKIALGMRLQGGAYGGANQFGMALKNYLEARDMVVVHDLKDSDIDLILITDTRPWLKSCAFAGAAAVAYRHRKPHTKILFRVNECDQKRGTRFKFLNTLLAEHVAVADQTVYISTWLRDLFEQRYPAIAGASSVIYNGADTNIFNAEGYEPWTTGSPLKLVTHHWSSNRYKGFDVYSHLDTLLGTTFRDKVTMTFIGNLPPETRFSHIQTLPPLGGEALAREIKKHHVYLTASLFEPAGMHHIEGALCGLPLLYRQSGALPEYCQGFGIPFSGPQDIEAALSRMFSEYTALLSHMKTYSNTAERMCEQYYTLIQHMLNTPTVPRTAPTPWRLRGFSSALFLKETAINLTRA